MAYNVMVAKLTKKITILLLPLENERLAAKQKEDDGLPF